MSSVTFEGRIDNLSEILSAIVTHSEFQSYIDAVMPDVVDDCIDCWVNNNAEELLRDSCVISQVDNEIESLDRRIDHIETELLPKMKILQALGSLTEEQVMVLSAISNAAIYVLPREQTREQTQDRDQTQDESAKVADASGFHP